MPTSTGRPATPFLDRAERVLQSPATRLALSFLIVLSVLPAGVLGLLPARVAARLDLFFLCLFTPEFALRVSTFLRQWREGRRNPWEALLLVADFVALLSFLPLQDAFPNTAYFRLFRLTRLVLLVGYWGEMASDLWRILLGRERRYQVLFVVLFGLVLSFAGAVLLAELAPDYDYDDDGSIDAADRSFRRVLWWSFRQVQDPGNLAARPSDLVVVLVSLALTFSGLLLFTFVIGISTGAMEELMHRTRERPVALRGHTVVLGFGIETPYLLQELGDIYRKNLKQVKGAVLGAESEVPDVFFDRRLRGYEYRAGNPERAADLERLGIVDAKRVLVQGSGPEPDARVIATLLAARSLTREAVLYADLEHERNFVAARGAGGPRTRVVGSGPFLADYLAQNLAYPGIYHAYRQLMTSTGCEIYTYLWNAAECSSLGRHPALSPRDLAVFAAGVHGVRVLGFLSAPEHGRDLEVDDLDVVLNPASSVVRERFAYAFDAEGRIRGETLRALVGISARFEDIRGLGQALAAGTPVPPSAPLPAAALSLALPMGRLRRVLVCGSGTQAPRVVAELLRYSPAATVTMLTREPSRPAALLRAVAAFAENPRPGSGERPSERRLQLGPDQRLRVETASGEVGTVHALCLDWTDLTRLLADPVLRLSETDTVAFMPRSDDPSADGLVALDCLRLADLHTRRALAVPESFHVLGLVRDAVKTERLAGRIRELAGEHGTRRFTILSSERARHQFLVQNLFVPGLNAVQLEMLGATGQHLCRLVPRQPASGQASGLEPEALEAACAERGLLFAGVELAGPDGTQVLLDPRELPPGRALPWSEVSGLYALGDQRTVDAATAG